MIYLCRMRHHRSLLVLCALQVGVLLLLGGPHRCDAGRLGFSDPEEKVVLPGEEGMASDAPVPSKSRRNKPGRLSPIIFLPGTGGSQLEARMDSTHQPPPGCSKETGWFRLWLDVMYMFTGDVHCWVDAMKLHYNATKRTSSNAPGLQVRVPSFGITDSVEYIDPSWAAWIVGNVGMYAAPLVNKLQEWGYERNLNIRGAPYDFRYAPHSLTSYMRSLRSLIEETYAANGGTRVTIMAHSMGGLVALYFLNHQPQAWKDHYVHRFISLNTPWKGTVFITKALASGINWGRDNIDPWDIRAQQRAQESSPLLIPSTSAWGNAETLVSTPDRNYTARDLYDVFFDDIGYPIGKEMAKDLRTADYTQANPGVKMLCVYTHGVPTPEKFIYRKGFHKEKAPTRTVMGPGDGTVNYRSLRGCKTLRLTSWRHPWSTSPRRSVFLRGFKGPNHDGIFLDERVHKLLRKALNHP